MKKMKGLFIVISLMATLTVSAQEYKVVTIVESIVPMGLGRSRIVDAQGTMDVNALTTVREGKKSKQDEVDREDVKEGGLNLKETKLLNFYSMMGINFGNVAKQGSGNLQQDKFADWVKSMSPEEFAQYMSQFQGETKQF